MIYTNSASDSEVVRYCDERDKWEQAARTFFNNFLQIKQMHQFI